MNQFIRTIIVFILFIPCLFAETLEIKLKQSKINIPTWSAKHDAYGAIIIIRGDKQAQWSIFLERLSKLFAQYGWNVALLNCSQEIKEPWIDQLPEVIKALKQKNHRIVLIHYGDELKQTMDYITKSKTSDLNGLVLLSAFDSDKPADKPPTTNTPIYDVVAQFDYSVVLQQQSARDQAFRTLKYHVLEVPGAHHDYQYSSQFVLSFLHGWMTKLAFDMPEDPDLLLSYIEPLDSLSSQVVSVEESNWSGYLDNPEKVFN